MIETAPCPHCGASPLESNGHADSSDHAVASLSREVQKLHDVAVTRADRADQERIDELSREVRQLRETIARLRGAASATAGYR